MRGGRERVRVRGEGKRERVCVRGEGKGKQVGVCREGVFVREWRGRGKGERRSVGRDERE